MLLILTFSCNRFTPTWMLWELIHGRWEGRYSAFWLPLIAASWCTLKLMPLSHAPIISL